MKPHFSRSLQLAALALTLTALNANAQNFTWTGAGGASNTWGNGTNWGGTGPAAGGNLDTWLAFSFSDPSATTSNNNLAGNFTLNRLTFTNAAERTLSGNQLNFVANSSSVAPSITLGSSRVNFANAINIGSGTNLTMNSTASGTIANYTGNFTGAGGITIVNGVNTLNASASNFSGGTTLSGGSLVVGAGSTGPVGGVTSGSLGTGTVALNGGIFRSLSAFIGTINNSFEIGGNVQFGSSTPDTGRLTLGGNVTLTGNSNRSFTVSAVNATHNPVVLAGVVSGTGSSSGITVSGTGILELSGSASNTYTGLTNVNGSTSTTLRLNKSSGTNAIAGNLTVTQGNVILGAANQISDTSTLSLNGANAQMAFAAGTTAAFNGVDETISALNISGGVININPSAAIAGSNTVTVTGSTTVSGGTFRVNNNSTFDTGTLTISGTGLQVGGRLNVGSGGLTFNQGASGFLDLVSSTGDASGANPTAGVIALGGNVTVNSNVSNSSGVRITQGAVATGQMDLNGGTRVFNVSDGLATDDFSVNIRFSDSGVGGNLIKTGAGTLLLNAESTGLNRNFEVQAGTLKSGANNAFGSGSLLVNGAGATLDLNNALLARSYANAVTVNQGTIISAATSLDATVNSLVLGNSSGTNDSVLSAGGSGIGRFISTGALALNSDSQFVFTLNSTTGTSDIVRGGGITLNGGSITFTDIGSATLALNTTFIVLDNSGVGAISGTFASFANGSTFTAGSNLFQVSYFGGTGNDLSIIVVPEPSTWMLLAGSFAVMIIFRRRRTA